MRPMGDQTHKVYDPQSLNDRFGSFFAHCSATRVTSANRSLAVAGTW